MRSRSASRRFEPGPRNWSAVPHIRIEWREVRHRVQGMQRLPQSVWIDALDGALALLGKRRDAERFSRLVEVARAALPSSMPWLARRPLQAIELADQWPRLVAVVGWLVEHPRPGIYLRQVDIPGVHSKFIEAHRAVLSELLDLALAPEAITAEKAGVGQFAGRYGFLDKPVRIRFRALDERIPLLPGVARPDVTLDAHSFACLEHCVSARIHHRKRNQLPGLSTDGRGHRDLRRRIWMGCAGTGRVACPDARSTIGAISILTASPSLTSFAVVSACGVISHGPRDPDGPRGVLGP